jgi:hypothetical protein
MMFTDKHLHNLAMLLLGVFVIIAATKRLGMFQEILTIIGLIVGIKLILHSLRGLDILK